MNTFKQITTGLAAYSTICCSQYVTATSINNYFGFQRRTRRPPIFLWFRRSTRTVQQTRDRLEEWEECYTLIHNIQVSMSVNAAESIKQCLCNYTLRSNRQGNLWVCSVFIAELNALYIGCQYFDRSSKFTIHNSLVNYNLDHRNMQFLLCTGSWQFQGGDSN